MNYSKLVAGAFAGSGALLLIYMGETGAGIAILASMTGFFVGDQNGQKETEKKFIEAMKKKVDGCE